MKEQLLLEFLRRSGLIYVYAKTARNLRYDANLRNAIALSSGKYLILMGNDDGMTDAAVLRTVHDELVRFYPVEVAITNFREVSSGRISRRVTKTGVLGYGPETAVLNFRNYSFVSGIVFEGDLARKAATDAVDGSEMYQMYLGTRLIATGGRLLSIDRVCVDKDLIISGQSVDSYRARPRLHPCPIVERLLPLGRLLQVVATGLSCGHSTRGHERNLLRVGGQLYRFTYPFWGIEYRVCQSWRYAVGVYLALRPSSIARGLGISRSAQLRLWVMYLCYGALALTIPISVFTACRPWLYAFAKQVRRR